MASRKEYELRIILLRKYSKKEDNEAFFRHSRKPMFVIQRGANRQELARGATYIYSKIEAANKLSQELINIHEERVQLVCDCKRVGKDLYYAADFMVEHHNDLIDIIYPVPNRHPSPFTARFPPSRTIPQHIETISSLDKFELDEQD